jgi:hypothetical protein
MTREGTGIELVSVHKAGCLADRPCICSRFVPNGTQNAFFKVVADLRSESIMCLLMDRFELVREINRKWLARLETDTSFSGILMNGPFPKLAL